MTAAVVTDTREGEKHIAATGRTVAWRDNTLTFKTLIHKDDHQSSDQTDQTAEGDRKWKFLFN